MNSIKIKMCKKGRGRKNIIEFVNFFPHNLHSFLNIQISMYSGTAKTLWQMGSTHNEVKYRIALVFIYIARKRLTQRLYQSYYI